MTFMLSNIRSSSANDSHDDDEPTCSSGNKRKSSSLISSPTKLKRIDRSHSRGSSLSLLSASSSISRLSPFSLSSSSKHSRRTRPSPKSPPTCTISLENVTVNICGEDKNLSKATPRATPLENIDVNVIPFPSVAKSEESEPQSLPLGGRRRRSNHLLGHRRSSSVHSISPQHGKENPSFHRQATAPKKPKVSSQTTSSQPVKPSSCSFKDMRFVALIRRSIMQGIYWREEMGLNDRMDVDEEYGSGSVTFDILSDSEDDGDGDEKVDPRSQECIMHNQDILLADKLGKQLADWGYREREPFALLSPSSSPLRMPLAPVALSAVTVSTPSITVSVHQSSVMSPVAAPVISIPELEGHASRATFLDDMEDIPMDIDVDRPARPVSPVARCLEPADENDPPMAAVETVKHSQQPLQSLLPPSDPSPPLDDSHELASTIVVPKPIPSPPPVSPFAPGSLSSQQRVLSPSQLVATLVLRHRDKMAMRSRGCSQVGNDSTGRGMRRRSPLACEL